MRVSDRSSVVRVGPSGRQAQCARLEVFDPAVDAVLAHADAVRLPAVRGAKEAVWAAACVLADEQTITELAETLAARPGAQVGCGL